MTREEAKEILTHNWTRVDNPNYSESELDEAFFMAIEALSANDGLRCALAGGRKCFAQGYDFTWCITCPHISEEDRQLVNHAVLAIPSAEAVPQLKQTDTLIIADALRYLAKDTERHELDRARAEELREQILRYGASMCSSADAVHGEWIFNPTDAIDLMFAKPKCSKCGFESSDGGNYCPNCGARMKGGDSE